MIISRALELGLTLSDLDLVDVGFIVELIEERNGDLDNDNVIEATPEILDRFF
ncbi:MAG: hypothetical protein MJ245_07510 [Clostridia bacterium]|nr:hypothetical protein [Clostridia bacterium]